MRVDGPAGCCVPGPRRCGARARVAEFYSVLKQRGCFRLMLTTNPNPDLPQAGERKCLLPNFCAVSVVLGVAIYGELLVILLTLASPAPLATFWARLGPLSVLVLGIGLVGSAALCLSRPLLARLDARVGAMLAWIILLGTASGLTLFVVGLLPLDLAGELVPDDGTEGLFVRALLISAIVGALMLRYLYMHDQWRRQVEAVANARFKTLQARIRPHFLFNSMNTIASLTQTDPRLAEEVVEDLADLFRASLATDDAVSTLADELELTRRYLNIERQRLGDRLRVHWELDELVPKDAPVPPLILQPLAENAVYHGIQPTTRPGYIRIRVHYRRGYVSLSLRNSLPEDYDQADSSRGGHHMALENVRQRMDAMFMGLAKVTQSRVEGDYEVGLVFPHPWRQA